MTPQEIQPGTRLELEILNRNGERIGSTYVSQLLEIQENDCLVVSAPIFEARLIYVPVQAQVRITFMHSKYGLLGFTAVVTVREHRGNIAVLVVLPEGELFKIQRRNHFRLDHMAKVLVWLKGKSDKNDKKSANRATTKNISGSGLCIVSEVDIPKGTEVETEFNLSEGVLIHAECIVMRNSTVDIKGAKSYEIGLRFTKLTPKDEESIIRYIFEQQRVLLKKEVQ